jgi:hypothetical protein
VIHPARDGINQSKEIRTGSETQIMERRLLESSAIAT